MNRTLVVLNLVLATSLGVLWFADRSLSRSQEESRLAESTFQPVGGAEVPLVDAVKTVELSLPGQRGPLTFDRRGDAWRLPKERDAFALPGRIEGLLKALLETRGVVVGRMSTDAARFGFLPGRTLEARLFDTSGALMLHVVAGDTAPGQHADDSYLAVRGREPIIQGTSPWPLVRPEPESKAPLLTDVRVIPGVLGRGFPAKIRFGGTQVPAITEIVRRDIPKEEVQRREGRGPRFEWFSVSTGGEKLLNDEVMGTYLSSIMTLSYDEIVAPSETRPQPFSQPSLTITLQFDDGTTDVLTVGELGPDGRTRIWNGTTGQVFLITQGKAAALAPNVRTLSESRKTASRPASLPSRPAPR